MNSRLHILLIPSWYPTNENPVHGIFNQRIAECVALNHNVSVLYVYASAQMNDLRISETAEGNLRVLTVAYPKTNGLPILNRILQYFKYRRAFDEGYRKLFPMQKPDLIQLNVIMPAGPGAIHLSRVHNIPLIIHEHWTGYYPADGSYSGLLKKFFTKKLVKHARLVMTVSHSLSSAMKDAGLRGKYILLPNVVREQTISRIPAEEKTTKLLHLSSLDDRQKNVSGILRAFASAYKANPALRLCIAGNSENAALRELSVRLGILAVLQFEGTLSGDSLNRLWSGHEALVMFSNYESFCVVVVEAMAYGKYVISSDLPAISEYFIEEAGELVPVGNEEALAHAMLKFAADKRKFDPTAVRKIVRSYSKETISEKLDEAYQFVLGNSG
jgi:glycosyltransferase involved in cell wall biosynthesis